MGRLSILRVVVTALLVGSAALAQQGLIVEPWRNVAPRTPPKTAPVIPAPGEPMPGSGLPTAKAAPSAPSPSATPRAPLKTAAWTPPVVTLLVDPWANSRPVTASHDPHWVPETSEIVDPWAPKSSASAPGALRGRPRAPHSTIF